MKKLELLRNEIDGHELHQRKENDARMARAVADVDKLRGKLGAEIGAINKKYEDRYGAGQDNPREAECAEEQTARDKFMAAANPIWEQVQRDKLVTEMRRINEETYFQQFTLDDDSFEMAKLSGQENFLRLLMSLNREAEISCKEKPHTTPPGAKLAEFDDIHCEYKSTFSIPQVGSIRMECNKRTTHLDAGPLTVDLQENLDTNQVIRGTVEVGFSKGLGGISVGGKHGPLTGELKGTIGGFVEFDNYGGTDAGLKIGANAKIGTDVNDKKITLEDGSRYDRPIPGNSSNIIFGIEARYGWNSGGSLKGKGILQGFDVH